MLHSKHKVWFCQSVSSIGIAFWPACVLQYLLHIMFSAQSHWRMGLKYKNNQLKQIDGTLYKSLAEVKGKNVNE